MLNELAMLPRYAQDVNASSVTEQALQDLKLIVGYQTASMEALSTLGVPRALTQLIAIDKIRGLRHMLSLVALAKELCPLTMIEGILL